MDQRKDSLKAASLEMWKTQSQDTTGEILTAVTLLTALILNGHDSVSAEMAPDGDGKLTITLHAKATESSSIGSAVPITRDGYFLTAGHCVDQTNPPLEMIAVVKGDEKRQLLDIRATPYRIVWKSKSEPDLAIIHAPIQPAGFLSFATKQSLRKGTPVAATGWARTSDGSGSPFAGNAAGEILEVSSRSTTSADIPFQIIKHSVPLASGDSGGPTFTATGELVGINSTTLVVLTPPQLLRLLFAPKSLADKPLKNYNAEAISPDMARVMEIIELDRNRPQNHVF